MRMFHVPRGRGAFVCRADRYRDETRIGFASGLECSEHVFVGLVVASAKDKIPAGVLSEQSFDNLALVDLDWTDLASQYKTLND